MIALLEIYDVLLSAYGEQYWWPAETFDEIIIGTILTQNTSWTNVEKAIINLKNNNLCSLTQISTAAPDTLAELIKPSGYFNQKAKRLIIVTNQFDIKAVKKHDLWTARKKLLDINGIGPETADSILLYAFEKPIFVIDAYTKRVFTRLGVSLEKQTYDAFQEYFMSNLTHDVKLFNEYHALIVRHCKVSCKVKPDCEECCLKNMCSSLKYYKEQNIETVVTKSKTSKSRSRK